MNAIYPAIYRDKHGELAATIRNDGTTLSITLCEVEFRGTDFDSLAPAEENGPHRLSRFSLLHGSMLIWSSR
jgi:hypothetical protein